MAKMVCIPKNRGCKLIKYSETRDKCGIYHVCLPHNLLLSIYLFVTYLQRAGMCKSNFYPVKMAVLFSLSECSKGNFVQTHLLPVASFI